MTFFSIIVPVYRVDAFLEACVDSVLKQSFEDYELILVDDGSDDRSGEICDRYAQSDIRVKVIHQANGGVAQARNSGIDAASGHYILFVDGDDYVIEGSLEKIHHELMEEEPDMLLMRLKHFFPDGKVIVDDRMLNCSGLSDRDGLGYFERMIRDKMTVWHSSSIAVKASYVRSNGFAFEKGWAGAEDMDFYLGCLTGGGSIAFWPGSLAAYRRERVGSITFRPSAMTIGGQLHFNSKWYERLRALEMDRSYNHTGSSYIAKEYMKSAYRLIHIPDEDKNALVDHVLRNRHIIAKAETPVSKYRQMKFLFRVLGIKGGLWFMKRYYRLRTAMKDEG